MGAACWVGFVLELYLWKGGWLDCGIEIDSKSTNSISYGDAKMTAMSQIWLDSGTEQDGYITNATILPFDENTAV